MARYKSAAIYEKTDNKLFKLRRLKKPKVVLIDMAVDLLVESLKKKS